MATPAEDDNPLEEARALCRAHHLFIAEVRDKVGERWVLGWVVYRDLGENIRPARLGRRRDPAQLLRFVCQLTADPVHA